MAGQPHRPGLFGTAADREHLRHVRRVAARAFLGQGDRQQLHRLAVFLRVQLTTHLLGLDKGF